MPTVFISYVRENSENVQRLASDLRTHGIKVWLDKNDIKPGFPWRDAIREAISQGDFFIACFSSEYFKRPKTYMNEELTLAIEELRLRHQPTVRAWFIPVLLSGIDIPDWNIGAGQTLRGIQRVELYHNWDDGINRILSVIQTDSVDEPPRHSGRQQESSDAFTIDELLRFDKVAHVNLIELETEKFTDDYIAPLLWGHSGQHASALFKLEAEEASAKNDLCKVALEEIEELFPVPWQRKRYPGGPVYARSLRPLGIRSVKVQGNLPVLNIGNGSESFTPTPKTQGSLELVGSKNNVKVNLVYVVSVDGNTLTRVTVKAKDSALVPLQIFITLRSEAIALPDTREPVWDRLEAGQNLAEILSTPLDGLQLNIERENARTISIPFGIKVRNHESLQIQWLDIDSLRTKWNLIKECTRSLTPEEQKKARDKWMEY